MSELDNYGKKAKKRGLGIVSVRDKRLMRIDPTSKVFFDDVLSFNRKNERLNTFIKRVENAKKARVAPFWKPIYDPSLNDDEEVVFEAGLFPAIGKSYFCFWEQKVKDMPVVQGKSWSIGTFEQYDVFLVWLINNLKNEGWSIEKALNAVVIDSRELGNYQKPGYALATLENTGSKGACRIFDLGNTFKMLYGGHERAAGPYDPLSCIDIRHSVDGDTYCSVPWLVLS